MIEATEHIANWTIATGSGTAMATPALIAFSFLAFNALRIVLHVPQLLTCLRDENGCTTINLWTWSSWIAASLSNALYMWLLLGDVLGLLLNLGNAAMCASTVCIAYFKRRRFVREDGYSRRSIDHAELHSTGAGYLRRLVRAR